MATRHLSVSAMIDASPHDVYAVIADYHRGHPRILPHPPFESLTVEQGGIGEGTHIRVEARILGLRGMYRSIVTEPVSGRVLVETNDNGYVTTFLVEEGDEEKNSRVTITTEKASSAGLLGGLSWWFTARLLRPVFVKELAQLATVVARETPDPASPSAQSQQAIPS